MNIKEDIKETFIENKYFLLFSALLFIASLLLGYFLHPYLQSFFKPVVNKLSEDVSSGAIKFSFLTIFLNNIFIVFKLFIFGVIFCFSIVILLYNVFFLGYFIANYGNLPKIILLILPHGIFELPSIIIANVSGILLFKYCYMVFSLKNSNPPEDVLILDNSYSTRFFNSLNNNSKYLKQALIFLAISVILMAIAGFIEVYITKNLALFFIKLFGL